MATLRGSCSEFSEASLTDLIGQLCCSLTVLLTLFNSKVIHLLLTNLIRPLSCFVGFYLRAYNVPEKRPEERVETFRPKY